MDKPGLLRDVASLAREAQPFPPVITGGLIEACNCEAASCSAENRRFPPLLSGGLIEAFIARLLLRGALVFPPLISGGLIEALMRAIFYASRKPIVISAADQRRPHFEARRKT